MSAPAPIAAGLWTAEPRLIGGRGTDGRIRFPMPEGDAASGLQPVALSPTGTLWSWTIQNFEPKRPPYQGPVPFAPYMVGYVELPGEVIVAARIVDVAEPRIGMPLALRIIAFDNARTTFAFGPVS
ncbi:MAG: DNA-binding protein [Sphingomonas bacterium]|nr:DNA-binding protein [Sphingomonas bacterium]